MALYIEYKKHSQGSRAETSSSETNFWCLWYFWGRSVLGHWMVQASAVIHSVPDYQSCAREVHFGILTL